MDEQWKWIPRRRAKDKWQRRECAHCLRRITTISPKWRVEFIWGIRMRDVCRGQIPKGQAEDLRLHMKVMGSHLSILGSRVTWSDLCFRKITLATVWKGDRLGGYFSLLHLVYTLLEYWGSEGKQWEWRTEDRFYSFRSLTYMTEIMACREGKWKEGRKVPWLRWLGDLWHNSWVSRATGRIRFMDQEQRVEDGGDEFRWYLWEYELRIPIEHWGLSCRQYIWNLPACRWQL